ncbi:hypothetical protein RRG08_042970 [Elysia crispata]|uniref:Uncharacterized protein n=1 Tax=Elysia crispata TaxID=231223 RepID=A0AAE1E6F6_9GAST|nr:hypothetical protein RRG08_042970 [Elysia crispata]
MTYFVSPRTDLRLKQKSLCWFSRLTSDIYAAPNVTDGLAVYASVGVPWSTPLGECSSMVLWYLTLFDTWQLGFE